MMKSSALLSPVLLLLLSGTLAHAQDLFARNNGRTSSNNEPRVRKTFTPERIELSTSAPIIDRSRPQGSLSVGLRADGDTSFLCGRFDALAGIRDLVTDDLESRASRMLLDIAEGELVGNGMTLLCQASPTLCDVLKHYRFSAQALLQLNYDKCRAIDQALDRNRSSLEAEAMRACLREKLREGMSLPRALRACEDQARSGRFKNLSGDLVRSIDLNQELEKLFGRAKGGLQLLPDIELTPQGVRGEVKVNPVEPEFLKRKQEIRQRWEAVLSRRAAGGDVSEQELHSLMPSWITFRVGREDLAALASLDPTRRSLLLDQLATDLAILDLARLIQEYDRRLAVAALKAGASEGTPIEVARQLQEQRKHLRESLEELLRTRELASAAAGSYANLLAHLKEVQIARAQEVLKREHDARRTLSDKGPGSGMYGLLKTGAGQQPVKAIEQPDLIERFARRRSGTGSTESKKSDCCTPTPTAWGEGSR